MGISIAMSGLHRGGRYRQFTTMCVLTLGVRLSSGKLLAKAASRRRSLGRTVSVLDWVTYDPQLSLG